MFRQISAFLLSKVVFVMRKDPTVSGPNTVANTLCLALALVITPLGHVGDDLSSKAARSQAVISTIECKQQPNELKNTRVSPRVTENRFQPLLAVQSGNFIPKTTTPPRPCPSDLFVSRSPCHCPPK